ncbi:MAG: cadherin-like beta sandwich domain-containing protein [Clostridiales bacterium]|nr:cadherin-like beta sandwich domain-containing protein [Clostridiales bacterium]
MNSKKRKILLRIFPVLYSLILCMGFMVKSPAATVRAAGGVTVDLSFQQASAQAGQIVYLDVVFSSFPSITRFGPIEIAYDGEYLQFEDATIGKKLDGFDLTWEKTIENSMVTISAVNPKEEEEILKNTTGSTGEDLDLMAKQGNLKTVFSSEDPVVVCTLQFRISDEARGEVKAWLGSISGLRDSALENVVAGAGSGASLIAQAMVSTDATLASLTLGSISLTPEFDPGIFVYDAAVSKNTTDVAVNAVAYNLNSTVTVEGESNLQMGNNTITVTVLAENGENTLTYTINVYRSDAISIAGMQIADPDGKIYDFVAFPETLTIPSNFYQGTCMIDGKEVPCFRKDGVVSVLIYLKEEGTEPGLYIYNHITGTLRLYEPGNMLLRSSLILTVEKLPVGVMVPDGFTPAKVSYGSIEIDGFVSKDKKTSIAYLRSEDGKAQFYVIDSQNGDFYPYKAQATRHNMFLYLFIVCASIAFVEALIIALLFYRNRLRYRQKAKPRRV